MDWACKSLVGFLDMERMSLSQLVERSGLARQTVHNHLKHLVEAGIVSQEAVKHGRGRPKVFYHKSKLPIEKLDGSDIVRLTFQKLKHACRFEKGGWCKEVKCKCTPEKCPLTIKTK
jgi:predicted ArsR family transcriptional regulator